MKKLVALILSLITVLSVSPFAVTAEKDSNRAFLPNIEATENSEIKEVPSASTLVGTPDLPPVMNQGNIGCCVSAAATYMQFTNAVSRYYREFHPEIKFEPSTGDKKYLFSPKWTFDLAGADTILVYNILKETGCVTQDLSDYYRHPREDHQCLSYQYNRPSKYMTQTTRWNMDMGQMETALRYRLKNFDQVWTSRAPYLVNGKIAFTTTNQGRSLLDRIKTAISEGNVVVTGGRVSAWQYSSSGKYKNDYKVVNPGSIGKKDDQCVLFSRGDLSGGHQLAVVGYDDDFTVSYKGVEMKGALQIVNSWGPGWENDGYIWVMYDAINEVSVHPELNFYDRVWTIDQFDFVDYKKDLLIDEKPLLYVDVEVETKNRESVVVSPLVKNSQFDKIKLKTPYMFQYSPYHPDHDVLKKEHGSYFNFEGIVNGNVAKATMTFDFSGVLNLRENSNLKYSDFGVQISANKGPVKVLSVKLKNQNGEVVDEVDLGASGDTISRGNKTYTFNKDLFYVKIKEQKGKGFVLPETKGFYTEGMSIPLTVQKDEDFQEKFFTIKDASGKALSKDENGRYLLPATPDAEIQVENILPKPVVPDNGSGQLSDENSPSDKNTEDAKIDSNVMLIISVITGFAVGAVVVIVVSLKKKNKKKS